MSSHVFEQKLAVLWPPGRWQDVTVLVAVSGGPDSVALLRALGALKRQAGGAGGLMAAHFNHRLRGAESDRDATFVGELCEQLGLRCELGAADIQPTKAASEEVARNARYDFLRQAAARVGARYLVTAHTADDQAETILHRILRGTGLSGLAGMSRVRALTPAVTLLRPMLEMRRTEVIAYLESLGQEVCQDQSNQQTRYTRNRLRLDLLPELARDYNPSVIEALLRLGILAAESQEVVMDLVRGLHEQCVRRQDEATIVLDCRELAQARPYVVRELFIALWREQHWPEQSMGYAQWSQLAELGQTSRPATQTFPGNVRASRQRDELTLTGR
jgi:tRNA(Ile)-lysidine synthase